MSDIPAILGSLIPIVAIVLGIGVAFWRIYWDHQRKRMVYDERRLMIERGMTPPPALLDEPSRARRQWTPDDSLRRGVVMLFLGIGLGIGYVILRSAAVPAPRGWLPLLSVGAPIVGLMGLGNLVFYVIVKRSKPAQPVPDGDTSRTGMQ